MNVGDYVTAREHLDKLSKQVPKADYVAYGLAALDCLTGHLEDSLRHLDSAIRVNAALRFQARNDSDFQNLAEDPRFTELLYPDPAGEFSPDPPVLRKTASRGSGRSPAGFAALAPRQGLFGRGLNVVAIGGGTGLSTLLKGLKRYVLVPASRRRPAPPNQ